MHFNNIIMIKCRSVYKLVYKIRINQIDAIVYIHNNAQQCYPRTVFSLHQYTSHDNPGENVMLSLLSTYKFLQTLM